MILGRRGNYFQGVEGDQCIIFRDLGSTYPPPPGEASYITYRICSGSVSSVSVCSFLYAIRRFSLNVYNSCPTRYACAYLRNVCMTNKNYDNGAHMVRFVVI